MKKEIEVKAKICDPKLTMKKIQALGCVFSEPLVQHDEVFVNIPNPYPLHVSGSVFLRIRNNNGNILFTMKKSLSNELDCIEKEVEVADAKIMREALECMGYRKVIEVKKVRRKAKYGKYEICIDEVKKLGSFIEVEKISSEDSAEVQGELFSFLKTLGVSVEDRVEYGYDTLMYLHAKNGKK